MRLAPVICLVLDVRETEHECPACGRCVVCEQRRCRRHVEVPPVRLDYDGHDSVCESRRGGVWR